MYKREIIDDFKKYENYNYLNDSEDIIDVNKLETFIAEVSSINLNNMKKEILKNNTILNI